MIKYLIIFFNLVGFIGYQVLFPGGVSISSDFPENVKPGSEFLVTITVKKGDLSGFAKFSQELPKGFNATLVNGSDATFSFKDQTIKFIWVALPAGSEFTFTYRVSVDQNVNGRFKVGGTFAYIFENQKQSATLTEKNITAGDVSTFATSEEAVKGDIEEAIDGIQCKRTTSPIPGTVNTFKVELRIDKPEVTGFAKIEESIPEGFYASELESKGGIFSFNNQLAKIIWMAIPDDEQFIVSYKLKAKNDVSGNQKIAGVFSYLKGDESFKYYIAPSTIYIEQEGDETPMIIIADEGGDFKEKEEPKVAEAEPKIEEPEPEEPKVEAKPAIPQPQADINYRVQVAAGHTPVSNDYFAKKFDLREDIIILNHEGWIKYTFGHYIVYKDCRDERNKVWSENKITDAFVTAYNSGRRITVQEALMITNQKWYN